MFRQVAPRVQAYNPRGKLVCIIGRKISSEILPYDNAYRDFHYGDDIDYYETIYNGVDTIVSKTMNRELCIIIAYEFDGINPITQVTYGEIKLF